MVHGYVNDWSCKSYAYDADSHCEQMEVLFDNSVSNCHKEHEACCTEFHTCQPTSGFMYSVYSSIGCVVFVVLLAICVFIWKKVYKKKKGGAPRGGFTGTGTGTTATGTTGTGTRGPRT